MTVVLENIDLECNTQPRTCQKLFNYKSTVHPGFFTCEFPVTAMGIIFV